MYSTLYNAMVNHFHPVMAYEDPKGVERYSCKLSLTLVLDGVDGQRRASAALPPSKETRYGRLGGPQGRSPWVREISPPTGIRSPDHPSSQYAG
jgi:hypothetical protein